MLSGRNLENAKRIRTGCSQHPEYKGKGALPNPHCSRCGFIQEGWDELVAAMAQCLRR